ncbi:hypothetical protein [Microbispora sp. ATCC PTA-5024]|uniref:hypothetical protein n=1 Tax=Microbispora sp. ATCC PTA-5024 TaxID=316330 RepID=UPI0003DBCB35|nr:hypothetical protein [Microbispora sp. ATCC PTA-5024]ETK36454.1 hypothetical protein MPTA5024_08955 [Microbispora sp. ATCC PTA-5024]
MPAKRFPSMLGLAVVTAFGLVALQSGEGYAAPAAPSSSTGLAVVAAVPADFVQGDDDTASDDWSGRGSQEQQQEQSQSGGGSSESSTGSSSSDDD